MNIEEVLLFVKEKLLLKSDPNDNSDIENFLVLLKDSKNWRCQKLLICIAIDLAAYEKSFTESNNELDDYIKLLLTIILEAHRNPYKLKTIKDPSPSIKFGLHLRKKHEEIKPKIIVNESTGCFRVLSFGSFIDRVLKENFDFNITELPADLDYNQKDRYYSEFQSGLRFSELRIKNIGSSTGWVYVGEKTGLLNEIRDKKLYKILDSIGYYVQNAIVKEKFVCLNYPDIINEIMYQPCTLTGDWGKISPIDEEIMGNDFFICYKKEDSWGRTFSVSGKLPEVKERTHKQNEFLNDHLFKISDLGELDSELEVVNPEKIIQSSLNRYSNAK